MSKLQQMNNVANVHSRIALQYRKKTSCINFNGRKVFLIIYCGNFSKISSFYLLKYEFVFCN